MAEKSTKAILKKLLINLELYIDARIEEKMPKCGCNTKPSQAEIPMPEPDKKKGAAYAEEIVEQWNSFAGEVGLSKVKMLTEKRKVGIRQRKREGILPELDSVYQALRESFWLTGDQQGTGWQPDFDWLFTRQGNWIKLIEGSYKSKGSKAKAAKDEEPEVAPNEDFIMNLEERIDASTGHNGNAPEANDDGSKGEERDSGSAMDPVERDEQGTETWEDIIGGGAGQHG